MYICVFVFLRIVFITITQDDPSTCKIGSFYLLDRLPQIFEVWEYYAYFTLAVMNLSNFMVK